MKTWTVRRSPRESESYHRRLLRAQGRSGQSVRAFAAARGLSAATLYAWRRRLGLTRGRLIEVAITDGPPRPASGGLVLQLFGRHPLLLPRDLADDEWARLLRMLSSC